MANSKYLRALLMSVMADRDLFVSLHVADPGEGGAAEFTGDGYQRQNVAPVGIAEGVLSNGNNLEFNDLPEGTASHFGVWDAERSGHFLMGGPLLEPRRILSGGGVRWREGEFILRVG